MIDARTAVEETGAEATGGELLCFQFGKGWAWWLGAVLIIKGFGALASW